MRNRHYSAEDTEHDEAHARDQQAQRKGMTPFDPPYAVCHALTKRGRICRKPAIGIDYQGGWPVCQEHLDAYLKREEQL